MARLKPRRARHLVAAGLPHGREAAAACAVLALLAHLLFGQLTLAAAVAFAVITRLSRWRLWWLVVPAAAGLILTLAAGPGHAAAAFAAGPAHVLGYLGHGRLAARLAHPLGAFSGADGWLPGQLPIALLAGAAEAAVIGWLDWVRTDEWAVAPPRPGAIAAARGAVAARLIGAGGVVTRTGCALGVVASTGAVAELRWSQVAGGALVVGASAQEAAVTSLQVVHAALRRRKPLVVIDAGADATLARVIEAACRATGTPLRGSAADLGLVIGERTAALVTARSPELAVKACADLAALAADLRRIGVDGDGLVWVPRGERLPVQSLTALIREGSAAGLAVLITTASPVAAAKLAGIAGTLLIHRISDPTLAATLAVRTGTRLRPAATAATAAAGAAVPPGTLDEPWPSGTLAGSAAPGRLAAAAPMRDALAPETWALGTSGPGTSAAAMRTAGTVTAGTVTAGTLTASAAPLAGGSAVTSGVTDAMSAAGLVPYPVVPAQTLLSLPEGQFVLAVSDPGHSRADLGRVVPARLPTGGGRAREAGAPHAREAQVPHAREAGAPRAREWPPGASRRGS